jgi:AraC-like DNA-binding protein
MTRLPGVNHVINLVGLVSFPLLYLYVREQTHPGARTFAPAWLWTPAAIYAVALVVRSALGVSTRVPFQWMLPVVLGFTVLCALQLRRRVAPSTAIVSATWVVALLALLNVAQIVRMVFDHIDPIPALVPVVVTAELVALVGLVAARSIQMPTRMIPAPRYDKSSLEEDEAKALLARVQTALVTDRLFADASLTLGRLAAAVDSTPHQLSEALNRFAATTFHELLNRHRVADVKLQLLDLSSDRYTIEGIGSSAGFGSRSALYTAFRRLEGLTPAEIRAQRPKA